ncbi:hypothetical protein Tco_1087916, partial [Tanacetum coccineum]
MPKFLPKAASDFATPKIKSTVNEVLQKTPVFLAQPSSTLVQPSSRLAETLSEYEMNRILLSKIDKSHSFMTYDKHLDLYNCLLNSIGLDKAISSSEINPDEVLKKRRHEDQDPLAGFDKEKKKRRKRKDFDPSIETDQSSSSPKEDVEDVKDDVGNVDDQLHDADTSKKDNYIWFTQETVIRPETPDPKWHKEP